MGHDRFYYLNSSIADTTDALTQILNTLSIASADNPDANPQVRIAYNTFNKNLGSQGEDFQTVYPLQADFSYSAGGGTRPDQAFADARTWNWQAQEGNRYVILITDGAPQGARTDAPSNYNTPSIINNNVIPAAQALKNQGITMITIGLSIDNVDGGRILLHDLADSINGKRMFFSAETGSDLKSILLQIVKTIMEDATVYGSVTDTISDSFYPVDRATGAALGVNDRIDLNGNRLPDGYTGPDPYGEIVLENGRLSIKWVGQEFSQNGWHGTVFVKAKEDLLGGNALATNFADATIEADSYRIHADQELIPISATQTLPLTTQYIYLPTPHVNVNELGFTGNDTGWTVYLGTEVDPKEQIKALFESIMVEGVVSEGRAVDTNGNGLPDTGLTDGGNNWYDYIQSITDNREESGEGARQTFPLADLVWNLAQRQDLEWWDSSAQAPDWDSFLEQALSDDGIQIPYHVYGLNDGGKITIKLTKEILEGEESDLTNHSPRATTVVNGADEEGNDIPVERYSLTVLYTPDYDVVPVGQGGSGQSDDYHTGTYGTVYQGHSAGTETSRNSHTVNAYVSALDVIKKDGGGSVLPGARFALYRADSANGAAVAGLDPDKLYTLVCAGTSGADGKIHLADAAKGGLAYGEVYYLIETEAPQGHLKLSTVWTVEAQTQIGLYTDLDGEAVYPAAQSQNGANVLPDEYPFNWDQGVRIAVDGLPVTALVNANGATVVTTDDKGAAVFAGLENGVYELIEVAAPAGYNQIKGVATEVTVNGSAENAASLSVEVDVPNNSGSLLPETGGIGTTIFYVVGTVLVLAAVILPVTKRRMNATK